MFLDLSGRGVRRLIVAMAVSATAAIAASAASASTFQTLYHFCHKQACKDGGNPYFNPLASDGHGNFFGVGIEGGGKGGGAIYEWSGNTYSKLANLPISEISGSPEPSFAYGKLVVDVDGNLYGATSIGGANHLGSVFELVRNPNDGKLGYKTLYSFCPSGNVQDCTDGEQPQQLTYVGAQEGKLYDGTSPLFGITKYGGSGFDGQTHGLGTAFILTKSLKKWSEGVIYSFCTQHSQTAACTDGAFPELGLIADKHGTLFVAMGEGGSGVTQVGYGGAVVSLTPEDGGAFYNLSVLYNFCATQACFDGKEPSGLAMDAKGNLFGVTTNGGQAGPSGEGVIYKLAVHSNYKFINLYSFCTSTCPEGGEPMASLAIDPNGTLYGTTDMNKPSLFAATPNASGSKVTVTVLHQFCLDTACQDGTNPNSALVPDGAGHYLGTTSYGGNASKGGTLFQLTP
jgi:uncharacterized repeat protein (TIGR03803 family)